MCSQWHVINRKISCSVISVLTEGLWAWVLLTCVYSFCGCGGKNSMSQAEESCGAEDAEAHGRGSQWMEQLGCALCMAIYKVQEDGRSAVPHLHPPGFTWLCLRWNLCKSICSFSAARGVCASWALSCFLIAALQMDPDFSSAFLAYQNCIHHPERRFNPVRAMFNWG